MKETKVSDKGWIVIPVEYRKKYNIESGDQVRVVDYGDVLSIVPQQENPIQSGRGLLSGKESLTDALLEERSQEQEREEGKIGR